ncbi:MAG: Na+/H+ antiporter NhaA [Myxococcales bacterium]|nr:Na+/H+ antiporter NhaA [Myxococcales bacterium]
MAHPLPDDSPVGLPRRPVHRLAEPLLRFMRIESASGIVLIAATVGALVAANSDVADAFQSFWNQTVSVGVSGFELSYPLWYWINDALMTIFFFVVGLEIKRELAVGELSEPRKVVLPVVAAAGGAVVPVLLFLGLQHGEPGAKAWAVPMATDIAFVVGALALLGPRIPHGLKVLMLTLAIVDDIMAVVVIAVFFTGSIHLVWSAGAIAGLLLTAGLRRLGVRRVSVYAVVGAFVWLCALKSGVHPTVAGVALGLITPASALFDRPTVLSLLARGSDALAAPRSPEAQRAEQAVLGELSFATAEAISPLARLETILHPWVAFVIMPVFALANAGVRIDSSAFSDPLALAIGVGLVVGKPLGITGASWLSVRVGIASLPTGVNWKVLFGGACLCGIGFTMALFIAALALDGPMLTAAKSGILFGSVASGVVGVVALMLTTSGARATAAALEPEA